MAKTLKKVNVVTVGVGFTGGILAAECAKAGLSVVGLERGESRTVDDFQHIHDEWRYAVNHGLMQDLSKETVTFRNNEKMKALPIRRLGSFLMGEGLGGAGTHWNGLCYRFSPYDFELKTMTENRYGKKKLSGDYLIQDWGLTYDQLEPYFDKFEKVVGCSGESKGAFALRRTSEYPLPPLVKTPSIEKFEAAAQKLGYNPYMAPAAIASSYYTNPDGMSLNQCLYCGFCERFACEYDAKAMPTNTVLPVALKTGNYEIRCNSNVVELLKRGDKVTGVKYVNTMTGEEFIQPADVVALCSYVFNNAKLLMLANIGEQYDPATGKGTLGRNYCYQIMPAVTGFFKEQMNLYAGAGALSMCMDDFNHDNFDHSELDFIHGGVIALGQYGKRPIQTNTVRPGTPSFGKEFKKESIYNFSRTLGLGAQGSSMPHRSNYLSLDDAYKDAYGLPLLRMTYNFTDQDRALYKFLQAKMVDIMKAMNPEFTTPASELKHDYNVVPYQTTHNTGGTVMGSDPKESVVNTYMQHWDCDNLFAVGAGNFTHNGGCNPTGTVGALAYRCAEGILAYSQKGGSLV